MPEPGQPSASVRATRQDGDAAAAADALYRRRTVRPKRHGLGKSEAKPRPSDGSTPGSPVNSPYELETRPMAEASPAHTHRAPLGLRTNLNARVPNHGTGSASRRVIPPDVAVCRDITFAATG